MITSTANAQVKELIRLMKKKPRQRRGGGISRGGAPHGGRASGGSCMARKDR